MTAVLVIGFAWVGLAFGSFATVLISRVPEKQSVIKPSYSKCPKCGTKIRARDNIPLVSYALLRGKCRNCGEHISAMYPLVELGVSVLFIVSGLHFNSVIVGSWEPLYVGFMFGLFFMVLLALSVIDLRALTLPNRIIYPSYGVFAAMIAIGWLLGPLDGIRAVAGFAIYGGGVFLIFFIYPRGMGFGDVRLAALIGLVLGSLGLAYVGVAAMAGILLGGVGAIVAIASGKGRKAKIPFGPFLAAGALVAAIFGHGIASWYLNQFTG